jgi:membrane associated rhomboid family serine protease
MFEQQQPPPQQDPAKPAAPSPQEAPPSKAPPQGMPEEEEGLIQAMLRSRATLAFVASTLAIFILCLKKAGYAITLQSLLLPLPEEVTKSMGGYSYAAVRDQGEWWRLITTMFVPRSGFDCLIYLHIFFQLGPSLEKALGTWRFMLLYLCGGAAGVAVGELVDPSLTAMTGGGTIGAVYAALGGIPGVVLGFTGSLGKTLRDSSARGAIFWIAFWSIFRYLQLGGRVEPVTIGSAVFGLLLGASLALSRRNLAGGLMALAGVLAVGGATVGAVAQGKRWQDGRLVDRGRPARGDRPVSPTSELGPPSATEPPLGTTEQASDAANEALGPVNAFLDQFGPLPVADEGVTMRQREDAREHLAALEKVANGPNLVLGELDPARVRLHLIMMNYQKAAQVADEHWRMFATADQKPRSRALLAVALAHRGDLDGAHGHLQELVESTPGLPELMPEAVFHYARVLSKLQDDVTAAAKFEHYLRLVENAPRTPWRDRLIATAKQKLGR